AERSGEGNVLGPERLQIEMSLEAGTRFLGRDDFEKLLLARGGAYRLQQAARGHFKLFGAVAAHDNNLMATISSQPWHRRQGLRSPAEPKSSHRHGRAPAR